VGDEEAELQQGRARIEEEGDAFPGGELPLCVLPFDAVGSAALPEPLLQLPQLGGEGPEPAGRLRTRVRAHVPDDAAPDPRRAKCSRT
jgi:hypothetical protein